MKNKKLIIDCFIIPLCLITLGSASASDEISNEDMLHIYVPRDITIENSEITIGNVAIIRGSSDLTQKAKDVALGQFSLPGQKIVLSRSLLLSRLACSGIDPEKIAVTGAQSVTVKHQSQKIKSEKIIQFAQDFLAKTLALDVICDTKPVRMVKDFIIPGQDAQIELVPALLQSNVRNQRSVRITILANGKQVGYCDLSFRLKYNCKRAVALADIPAGAVITSTNVKIENILSNSPMSQQNVLPYGQVARCRIHADTVLRSNMLIEPEPQVVIKRNETVLVAIKKANLAITANGKALQKGRVGECIRVKMQISGNSQRIIWAKVNKDGSVEPVY